VNVGLFLSAQHARGSLAEHVRLHAEQVRVARENGFVSVFAGQHYLSSPFQMLHPVPLLARLAAEGELLAPMYNPIELLELASCMDAITGGRFVLGLGLGYRDVEFDAFAVPKGKRVPYLEEALILLPRLWTEKDVDHRSERVHLEGVTYLNRPERVPHPPIWVAANNDAAVVRAARLGDAWFLNPHARLDVVQRQSELYRQARAEAGLPPATVVPMLKEVMVAESSEEAWADARPYLEEKYRVYVRWGQGKVLPQGDDLDQPIEELRNERFIVGDPDQVVEGLERHARLLGVNHFALRLQWAGETGSLPQAKVLRSIRLLGRHVIPELSRRHGAGPALT
jgi:alkanesulfonate monooxygenase SsuD/methylene tetrahydromethanopterin reductase-like flavin-dependent oxidoreductase (luciferase family)